MWTNLINAWKNITLSKYKGMIFNLVKCHLCRKDIDLSSGKYIKYGGENTGYYHDRIIKIVCEPCIKTTGRCRMCNGNYHASKLVNNTCNSCISSSDRHFLKNYSYKIEREVKFQGKPKDDLYYGVELEVESLDKPRDAFFANLFLSSFCVTKKDVSIENGFEIVSTPCSIDKHYTLWDGFFNNISPTLKKNRTCGMHVHVSKDDLTDLQIGKILYFIHNPENREFVEKVAGRKSGYHNNFESQKTVCMGRNRGIIIENQDRHTAVNVNNAKTIEFRIFASTLSKKVFMKNLEFCRALVKFTHPSVTSIKELNYKKFYEFVSQRGEEYPHLIQFLNKNAYNYT